MSTNDPRGSLWHRWDPHLHAPGTLLNDQFGGNWDAYLQNIEASSPRIEALGVTDYFCINTYKAVRAYKSAGRLPHVKLLFPNVELRIDTKTTSGRAINIHLLFSPADPDHEEQIERILGQLRFERDEREYYCTRADLIALGKVHDPKQTDEVGALKIGANQFKTSVRDLKRRFKSERWMRDNCLVAVQCKTGDGTAGLQDDDAFAVLRKEIESFADIMFSSRPKDRSFWIGEHVTADRDFLEKNYRGPKPCLHGSDAHEPDEIGKPAMGRYCWLKGDLSFETLRQAVVEPGGRVRIGIEPPSCSVPALTIQTATFDAAPWMQQSAIDLNGGLIAIIGARGSGKTALADVLAMGAYAPDAGKGDASFLKRASRPTNHLGDAAVKLSWADGTFTNSNLLPGSQPDEPEFVRYLSQHFVEKLCSSAGLATELRAAMERVVFDSMEQGDRLDADDFDDLAKRLLEPIRVEQDDLQAQIESIGDAIVQEDILNESLPRITREHTALVSKIESSKAAQLKLIPKGNEERAKLLARLETQCVTMQTRVEGLRYRMKLIDDLDASAGHLVATSEPLRFATMQNKFSSAGLTAGEWKAFQLRFSGDTALATSAAKSRAEKELRIALDGDPARAIDSNLVTQLPLNLAIAERNKVKSMVGIDADLKRNYDDAQKQISSDEIALAKLDAHIAQAKGADDRRNDLIVLRRERYVQLFERLVQEEKTLTSIYAPLKARLAGQKGALGKLAFVTERTIQLTRWCEQGEDQFDLRSGHRLRGRGSIKKLAEELLEPAWKNGSAVDVATAMDAFRDQIQAEMKKLPAWVSAEQRRGWLKSISQWLYSIDHIRLRYGIEYDGVAIEQLSPGTRGVVLLLLYLAIDLSDHRPLIIDQPEENLDPKSVFEELVPHFRDACLRRQVIIVTHNANLVVNTDADQVIVASSQQSGAGLPKIGYKSGSLENPEIRGLVCQILEGGERAFLDRERRYRLRRGHNLLEDNEA